jgi:hypothetical protein
LVAEWRLGKEAVEWITAEFRIPGVEDWKFEPTPLEIGLRTTCEAMR